MNTEPPMILRGDEVIIYIDGDQQTVGTDHKNYGKIMQAIRDKEWNLLPDLINMTRVVADFTRGMFEIKAGEVYWKGTPFHTSLTDKLLDMHAEGFPIDALVNFMNKLMENPSSTSVQELYTFLEKNQMPITPDGDFLAYKKVCRYTGSAKDGQDGNKLVDGDLVDIHSKSFRNNPGDVVQMDRNMVNDNRTQTCSAGLHFARLDYMPSYGSANDPIVLVKINPRDVVSIPTDYHNAKGRCCRYEVVSIHKGDQYTPAFETSVVDENDLKGE